MSLVQGYSSDEETGSPPPAGDVFGLSAIHTAKKLRVQEAEKPTNAISNSAPFVLSEVASTSNSRLVAVN
jgi:pre-mRNA-processing factor 17